MSKMKKRMFSFLLAAAMMLGIYTPTLAAEPLTEDASESRPFSKLSDTQFDGIKKSVSGQYVMVAEEQPDQEGVPVGRLDVDLIDADQYEAVLASENISDAVKESLRQKRESAVSRGDDHLLVTIFSPWLIKESGRSTRAIPTGRTNYTWNGHSFLIEKVYYRGIESDIAKISEGSGTKELASGLTSMALIGIGVVAPVHVALVASGLSLLQAFYQITGINSVYGSTQDTLHICLTYDLAEQWTWADIDGEWYLGLYTEKATVTSLWTKQFYFDTSTNTGRSEKNDTAVNKVVKGDHFSDDWQSQCQTAWNNRLSGLNEQTQWTIGGKTFSFGIGN